MTQQINPFLQLRILILLVIFSSIFITTKSFSQITQEDIQTLTSGEIALPVKKAILGSYSFAKDSPSDFKVQLQLAKVLASHDLHKWAQLQYMEAIKLNPDNMEAHYLNGISLELLGESESSLAEYQKCAVLDPDYAPLSFRIGELLGRAGKIEASVEYLKKYLQRRPDCVAGQRRLAQSLVTAERYTEAKEYLSKVLLVHPNEKISLTSMATVQLRLGNMEELAEYQKLLTEDGVENIAFSLIDALEFNVELLNKSPNIWITKSEEFDKTKQFSCAIVCLKIANEGRPNDPVVLDRIGRNYFRLGKYRKAVRYFNRSLSIDGSRTITLHNRALAFIEIGKIQSAIQDVELIFVLEPDNNRSSALKKQLDAVNRDRR